MREPLDVDASARVGVCLGCADGDAFVAVVEVAVASGFAGVAAVAGVAGVAADADAWRVVEVDAVAWFVVAGFVGLVGEGRLPRALWSGVHGPRHAGFVGAGRARRGSHHPPTPSSSTQS